jgi:hypothetical protein
VTGSDVHVLERLLQDAEFRARFRRDPAAAARKAGLEELAEEFELGDPMQTLEPRESRSSLAGVLLAGAFEGLGIGAGRQHLLPPVDHDYGAGAPAPSEKDSWAFVRAGESFPGNHPDYAQLRGYGAAGALWDPDDANVAAGIANSRAEGFATGIWLVPNQNESPQAFAERAADAIGRYHPDKVVLDIEAIGKGYAGSPGWRWSDEMMNAFSHLQPNPPPLAVTVEPLQDDFNYAAYTSRGAEVWPQSYLGDMTPRDPQDVIDRVVANGVPRNLVVPVLGPNQLDGYNGPHNLYTADDIQGRTPHAGTAPPVVVPDSPNAGTSPPAAVPDSPNAGGFRPALTQDEIAADRAARDAVKAAESPSVPTPTDGSPPPESVPNPLAAAVQSNADPDDLQGNLDDEDAGGDEEDGSNEDEPDEGGSDDDSGDSDSDDNDDEGSDDESDDDQDAPGEGSNGEDANDPSSDGDSSDDGNSSSGDSSDSSGDSSTLDGATPDLQGVDPAYPGDNAPRGQVAAWMAGAAQKRGLPPELPVMAALTESGLSNLDHGDADSVGFFQMRVSIWNQGAYSGYPHKPERQLDWFLDHAEAVKKQRLARGLPVDDPKQYGDWIADVENPAAQYRGRYQ